MSVAFQVGKQNLYSLSPFFILKNKWSYISSLIFTLKYRYHSIKGYDIIVIITYKITVAEWPHWDIWNATDQSGPQ